MTENEKIKQVLTSMVEQNRYVFWYDEGGQMKDIATSLDVPGINVLEMEGNAFSIKYQMQKGEQPETGYVIYSTEPMPEDEQNWLLDYQEEGALFSADMSSLYAAECGIAMELKEKVVDKHLAFFKKADNRNKLAAKLSPGMDSAEIEKQMLAVVCKSNATCEAFTYALITEANNEETTMQADLKAYHLEDFYWQQAETYFGYHAGRNIKDLIIVLFKNDMQSHLKGKAADKTGNEQALTNEALIFMRDWRDSRTYGDLYTEWANRLEDELGIKDEVCEYSMQQLLGVETFPCIDKVIAGYLLTEVINATITTEQMEAIIEERENKLFFDVARHTLRALLQARYLFADIEQKMNELSFDTAKEGFSLYEQSLYTIDLHYRHYIAEANLAESKQLLAQVTERVERTYTNHYLLALAKKWQPLIDGKNTWKMEGIFSQSGFYTTYVYPFITNKKKIFVIISDALRYETMVELSERIAQMPRMETDMKPAMLSTLPSYTQLGMAALLPHKQLSYEKDADEVFADGMSTKGTEARSKVLQKAVARSKAITAEDFLKTTNAKTAFKDFDLIYIYSNMIDKTGDDKASEGMVFKATEDEMAHILQMIDLIRNGNGCNILITSDHGYLYQNETLDETDFSDFKVMGDTIIQDSRRFVIGRGLEEGDAVKTWSAEEVGLTDSPAENGTGISSLQVQTAKGLNRIRKQGAGSRFVHGGSMPQEVVMPVLHVNIKKKQGVSEVSVDILNKKSKITTNTQTISFYQNQPVSEKVKEVTLRFGFYDQAGNLLSDSITLTFGSTSEDSTQRELKHRFMFKRQLSELNGQEIYLRKEQQVAGSSQFKKLEDIAYKVSVLFMAEF
mgnify:FL=1